MKLAIVEPKWVLCKRYPAHLERENKEKETMTLVNSTQNKDNSFLPCMPGPLASLQRERFQAFLKV